MSIDGSTRAAVVRGGRVWLIGLVLLIGTITSVAAPPWVHHEEPRLTPELLFKSDPAVLTVALFGPAIQGGTVTDVEVADFNGDGRNDIAVAWYADHNADIRRHLRCLSFLFGTGVGFAPPIHLDLFSYDPTMPAASIFRYGTSDIGVGDFDGDGDADLAVTAFFGDELWFVENLGDGTFAQYVKHIFGFSSPAQFMTPPEAMAADFDGDGRDELAYIADPLFYIDGQILHFWKTEGSIADMERLCWEGFGESPTTQWTRGLAVADCDGDGLPDLCFSGSVNPPYEDDPVFTVWYGLDVASGYFQVHHQYPAVLCSDVAAVGPSADGPAGLLLTDLDGTRMQYWEATDDGGLAFSPVTQETGYAGLSPDRGMTAVLADVDGDGRGDLITKQKLGGAADANQIEITLRGHGASLWSRVSPTPIDTTGFVNFDSEILRPRNLAVADLHGNALPEIVAGFALTEIDPTLTEPASKLEIAVWENSCLGDVNLDGRTDSADLVRLLRSLDLCAGDERFNPHADLDKSGCVTEEDWLLCLADLGCVSAGCDEFLTADMNCDCYLNAQDVGPFMLALEGEEAYAAAYPDCHWLNGDCNDDGTVDYHDIDLFLALIDQDVPVPLDGHAGAAPILDDELP